MPHLQLTIQVDLNNHAVENARDQELERIFLVIRQRLGFTEGPIENAPIYASDGNLAGFWRVWAAQPKRP